jgi:hypothetical protein
MSCARSNRSRRFDQTLLSGSHPSASMQLFSESVQVMASSWDILSGGEGGITAGVLPFALRAALRAFKSLQAI